MIKTTTLTSLNCRKIEKKGVQRLKIEEPLAKRATEVDLLGEGGGGG